MAVIFDMDGVLFDSEPLHIRAWQAVTTPLGYQFASEWFLPWVGIPDWQVSDHLHREYGLGASGENLLQQKRTHYLRITAAELRAFDGVADGVRALLARGIPIAVATSSNRENSRHTLACSGLDAFFPVLVSAEDVTRHKPAPDPFLLAAERLGVPAAQCIIIEDSPAGVQAGRAAGCTVLAVMSTHSTATLDDADHIFVSTAEAIAWALANVDCGLRTAE